MSLWDLWRVREAAKIDFLEKQPGFAQTPEGKAAIHLLKTRYPKQGDPVFPLLMREFKNGNLLLSPHYLDHYRQYLEALRNDDSDYVDNLREQLDGDRPDGYFWRPGEGTDPRGNPRMNPVQPGMIQNIGRMLRWMKGANQPLPNMDAKTTTLPQIESMYHSWRDQYDRKRDPSMGAVVHEFPDGWTMRSCDNDEQCYDEGEEMNHCGAKYAPLVAAKTHQLFSLRDPDNWPHASVVYRPGDNSIEDIRGKNNQAPNDKYTSYLSQWFPTLGEGVTISGHPNAMAPPIPEVQKFGLPVIGAEAQRQGFVESEPEPYDDYDERDERIASWQITADKLNDYLRNPQSRPEFADPDHPDYEVNNHFLNALERTYHNEQTDHLFPWLASEYLKGRLKNSPDRYGNDAFFRQKTPNEHLNEVEALIQRYRDAGWNEGDIEHELKNYGPKLWEAIPREEVMKIGDWLHNTNSQNPTRQGFDINRTTWGEMNQRVQDFADWRRRKNSIEKAVHKFKDGMHWYPLQPGDVGWEGTTMQNCIGGYADQIRSGRTAIYSLRDKNGNPKVDMEIRPGAFYNPKTKEMFTPEEMQAERRRADGSHQTCPTCGGTGWDYERDDDGDILRDEDGNRVVRRNEENRRQYCPECNGGGTVRITPEEARQDLDDFQPTPVNGGVVQVQGKQNKPPIDKYHPYVKDFINKINQLAEKSGQQGPKWDLGTLHYNNFDQLYDPEQGRVIYYHPGDYGLPDPGVTSDYLGAPGSRDYYGNPGLVYSYLNSGTNNDMNNRRRAKYMYHWALYNNDMDKLHEALNNEDLMNEVKREVANQFDPYAHPDMQAWDAANPTPQNEIPVPGHYDAEGNPRWGTPEYEAEAQAWREAEEQQYLAERRWSDARSQMANEIKNRAAEEVWPTSRQAQMLEYLNGHLTGNPPETLPEGEEEQHVASVRKQWAPICLCGSCDIETWDFIREANDQVWNRTRNNLRRNNILTPVNQLAWESLKHHYPDHSALSEWLHKEFRKGRFKMPQDADYYLRRIDVDAKRAADYEKRAEDEAANGNEENAAYYRDTVNQYREGIDRNLENARQYALGDAQHWRWDDPTAGRIHEATPRFMDTLADVIKRRSQREKEFNYLREEFPTLANAAREEEQIRRIREDSGVTVHQYPDGYTMRYLPNGDVAELESELMGHCIRSYRPGIEAGTSHNFSLRDEKGIPHVTFEVHPKDVGAGDFVDWDSIADQYGGKQGEDLPPEVAAKKAEYEQWLSQQQGVGTSGYNNNGMGRELQEFLAHHRTQGNITPNFFGGRVNQITGGRGSVADKYSDYIKQYMDTVPYADRPAMYAHNTHPIYHVDDLTDNDDQPTDQYGFRLEQTPKVRWNNVVQKLWDVNDPLAEGRYDPARGERAYQWAAKRNQLGDLYSALDKWESESPTGTNSWRSIRPPCPNCGVVDDVEPVENVPGEDQWRCTYCDRTHMFNGPQIPAPRGGVQYTPYQAAVTQHLGPMLSQHPELVERATQPVRCTYCGSNNIQEYPNEPGYLQCRDCGGGFRKQASFTRHPPHLNQYGERCICKWGDDTHSWPRHRIYANDWGEDSDSSEINEPDHYPNVQNPRLDQAIEKHPHMSDQTCSTCGDQLNDLGECARCDWGGFNHSEDATNPWPHYPFSDENAGIRNIGSFDVTVPEDRWDY